MDKKLLVLPLDESLSKLVSRALANETSIRILNILAEEPMPVSKISEILNIPITTAQYNVERLLDAGLVRVKEVKWSRKGREVKIYEPQEKYIIITPKKSDRHRVLTELKKLLPVISIGFGALIGWFASSGFRSAFPAPVVEEKSAIPESVSGTVTPSATPSPVPPTTPEVTAEIMKGQGMAVQDYLLLIFLAVIMVTVVYLVWKKRN